MELNQALLQIDSLKKDAEILYPHNPELEKIFWDKFNLDFNYNSNHLEGNTLTYGHTEILLKSGDVVGKYNIRELEEMKAHNLALKIVLESAKDSDFTLSQKFIKEINQIILVEPFYKEAITPDGQPTRKRIDPGQYKKFPNSVLLQNGTIFDYSTPQETPVLMGELIEWYKKEEKSKELHPVHLAAIFHYRLVRIHPFDDSNGRTSRLLMNFILHKNGYAPLVIQSTGKKDYLIALNEADAGEIESFVKYTTSLQLHWQELFLKALKGEKIEEARDFEKEVELFKKDLKTKLNSDISEIKKIHQFSFLPLKEKLKEKLSKLNEFYDSTVAASVAIDEFGSRVDIYNVVDDISICKTRASHFIFTHQHSGYKASKQNINYTTECILTLFQHNYQIEIKPTKKTITLNNNEYLSFEQIEEICASAVRKEFEFIKGIPV